MAKFVINSTSDQAIRAEKVLSLEVAPYTVGSTPSGWVLEIQMSLGGMNECVNFERGETKADVEALAATVLAALEAAS